MGRKLGGMLFFLLTSTEMDSKNRLVTQRLFSVSGSPCSVLRVHGAGRMPKVMCLSNHNYSYREYSKPQRPVKRLPPSLAGPAQNYLGTIGLGENRDRLDKPACPDDNELTSDCRLLQALQSTQRHVTSCCRSVTLHDLMIRDFSWELSRFRSGVVQKHRRQVHNLLMSLPLSTK